MEFFLIILLIVFIFLVAKSIDEKNKSHNKQGYTSNHNYDFENNVYDNETDKIIPASDERKKMISYRWSAVSIVRGKLKNVSGNYMLVKQFSSKKSQTILMTLML